MNDSADRTGAHPLNECLAHPVLSYEKNSTPVLFEKDPLKLTAHGLLLNPPQTDYGVLTLCSLCEILPTMGVQAQWLDEDLYNMLTT